MARKRQRMRGGGSSSGAPAAESSIEDREGCLPEWASPDDEVPEGAPKKPKPHDPDNVTGAADQEVLVKTYMTHMGIFFDPKNKKWRHCCHCNNDRCNGMEKSCEASKGHGDFFAHLKTNCLKGADCRKLADDARRKKPMGGGGTVAKCFRIGEEETGVFHLLKWCLRTDKPLSVFDNPLERSMSKCEHFWRSSRTIKKHMGVKQEMMECRIAKLLDQKKSSLLFDGWTHGKTHFLAIFSNFVDFQGLDRFCLLSISPLLDALQECEESDEIVPDCLNEQLQEATNFAADTHARHVKHALKECHDMDNLEKQVVCAVGDNCSTNKSTCRQASICSLHC